MDRITAAQRLARAQDLNQRVAKSKTALQAVTGERNHEVELLRAQVRAGGTTGDIFADFAACEHRCVDTGVADKYRLLDARLRGYQGQLLLVSYEQKVESIHHIRNVMARQPATETRVPTFVYGLITSVGLVFERINGALTCSLPVEQYFNPGGVEVVNSTTPCEPFSAAERVKPFWILLQELAPLLLADRRWVADSPRQVSELVIGDEPVREWLATHFPNITFESLCERAGKPVLTPSEPLPAA